MINIEYFTHLGDERIGEGRLAMVDVGNHGHVPYVLLLVHAFPHLVCCEVNLQRDFNDKQITKARWGKLSQHPRLNN